MDFGADEAQAVLSKSLAIIEKASKELNQLDRWLFPTNSSETARKILLDVLTTLRNPNNLSPISPEVLYNKMLSFQKLAEILKQSSIDQISWPLVGYCDNIWASFFGEDGPGIFYSVTPEYNYSIFNFSEHIANLLNGLLPPDMIAALINHRKLYCLQLASAEHDNLSLYAIIGHEFGHPIFNYKKSELTPIFVKNFSEIASSIFTELAANGRPQADYRFRIIAKSILGMAEELFCDLVGSLLMGPAFFLSSYEMSWGLKNRCIFSIPLPPHNERTNAYPSSQFRLHCIKKWATIDDFCEGANKEFAKLKGQELKNLTNCLSTIPISHNQDTAMTWPSSSEGFLAIQTTVNDHLPRIKQAIEKCLEEWNKLFMSWYKKCITPIKTEDIALLLSRLENDILPNITPDKTLLGIPAEFVAILNASALFRIQLLASKSAGDYKGLSNQTGKIERLTAKAFEVSFVQNSYNKWKEKK